MELKELAGDQDLYDVMKKQKRKQKQIESKAADGYKKEDMPNLFDIINKKLGNKKGNFFLRMLFRVEQKNKMY